MENRIKKCIDKLKELNCDGLVISNPTNITYLTNFKEAEGYLLIARDGNLFYFTNFLYQEEAKKNKSWQVISSSGIDIFEKLAKLAKKLSLKKVGFEAKHLTYLEYKEFKSNFDKVFIEFLKTIDFVEVIRSIKSFQEISFIKESINITEEAFDFISEIYRENMTEMDLSIEIERFLKLKANNIAFSPIIADMSNSFYPHYIPNKNILDGDFFLVDIGAKFNNYCADITRVFLRKKMSNFVKKIFDIVKKAQDLSIKKIKEGIKIKELDLAARNYIQKKGFGKFFGHNLGHGLGLSVHELPYVGPNNEEVLKENMVITIEPAIYLNNRFGVRLEDVVLVKNNGAEILSRRKHIYFL